MLLSRSASARPDGEWLPFTYDAFYHAHRILAVASGAPLPQFDTAIQAPTGYLIPWPWAYDWVLGKLTALGLFLVPDAPPMLVAGLVPFLGFALSIGFVLAIARELKLGPAAAGLAGLLFALAPLVTGSHMIGAVDHHWAEALAVLAAAWSLLRWQRRGDARAALLHGVLLGAAQGVQNGMFLLQAFTLLALVFAWWRQDAPAGRGVAFFVMGLLGATLTLLLPSLPFRIGAGEFYYLGWFHLLAACGSSLFAVVLARTRPGWGGLALLSVVAVAVFAVLASQFLSGARFVAADRDALAPIQETVSVLQYFAQHRLLGTLRTYTPLPLLAPLLLLPMAWRAWNDATLRPFVAYALPCCILQCVQMRFWSFGLALAALTVAWWVQRGLDRSSEPPAVRALGVVLVGLGLLAAPARDFGKTYELAGSEWYRPFSPMIEPLRQACAERPRIVLADDDYGHLITYFTRCRVITNHFIIGPADYRGRMMARWLLSMTPEQLARDAPEVELVLADVTLGDYYEAAKRGRPPSQRLGPLEGRLLDPRQPVPEGFALLAEGTVPTPAGRILTHRLVEVTRAK